MNCLGYHLLHEWKCDCGDMMRRDGSKYVMLEPPSFCFCFCFLEIARSLADSLFYFNTFGGSPLACAIGSAVLEVCITSQKGFTHFTEQLQNHKSIIRVLMYCIIKDLVTKLSF